MLTIEAVKVYVHVSALRTVSHAHIDATNLKQREPFILDHRTMNWSKTLFVFIIPFWQCGGFNNTTRRIITVCQTFTTAIDPSTMATGIGRSHFSAYTMISSKFLLTARAEAHRRLIRQTV